MALGRVSIPDTWVRTFKNQGNAKCCRTREMLKNVDAQFATSFLSLKYQKCPNSRGGLHECRHTCFGYTSYFFGDILIMYDNVISIARVSVSDT